MTADPRRIAPGHNRLMRVVTPNDPAPPDPLDGLVRAVFPDHGELHLFVAFVDHFGHVLTFEQIAVIFYGDTPVVRRASRTRAFRRGYIGSYVFRLNERLVRYRQPYRIESVRGVGYRLVAGAPTQTRKRRYTPAERAAILERYRALTVQHPDWTKKRRCEELHTPVKTVGAWLQEEKTHAPIR